MRLSPAGRHIKAIVMSAAGSKPVRIHNQFSARRESADNKASPPASAAACRKISSPPHSFPRRRVERKTWRVASLFLDAHWTSVFKQVALTGTVRMTRATCRPVQRLESGTERLSARLSADGPRQTFNSPRLFWHSAQTAALHRRAREDDFHLDCARPPAFEPDGRRRTPFGV